MVHRASDVLGGAGSSDAAAAGAPQVASSHKALSNYNTVTFSGSLKLKQPTVSIAAFQNTHCNTNMRYVLQVSCIAIASVPLLGGSQRAVQAVQVLKLQITSSDSNSSVAHKASRTSSLST
jgi:hypothetical protein